MKDLFRVNFSNLKHITIYIIIFLTFALSIAINAQKRDHDVLSLTQKSQLATDLTNQGSYYIAIDQLKILTANNLKNISLIQKLGEAYYHARDYEKTIEFLGKLTEINDCKIAKKGAKYSVAVFYYADALKYL